jgi:hypothetical protein
MRDTRTVSSPVVTVVRTLLLPLANKSFMIAAALPTHRAVAPAVALFAVEDNRQHLVRVTPNIMRLFVPVVDVQPLYHLCLVKTARSTVVNVISRSERHALRAAMTRVAIAMAIVVVMVGAIVTVVIAVTAATIAIVVIAGKTKPIRVV